MGKPTQNKSGAGNSYLRFIDPLNTMGLGRSSSKSSGKNGQPSVPIFQPTQIMNGNDVVGKTYMQNGQLVNQYLPTAGQQQSNDLAQQGENNLIPQIGQATPEELAAYKQMSDDYANNAAQQFMTQYEPQQRALTEAYATKFGGLTNTPYVDAMRQMEQQVESPALQQIANNAASMGQQLYNNAQSQKINDLQGLGYVLNNNQQNFLNGLNGSQSFNSAANGFNQQNFQNLNNQYQFGQNMQLQNNQALMQALAGAGAIAAKAF